LLDLEFVLLLEHLLVASSSIPIVCFVLHLPGLCLTMHEPVFSFVFYLLALKRA